MVFKCKWIIQWVWSSTTKQSRLMSNRQEKKNFEIVQAVYTKHNGTTMKWKKKKSFHCSMKSRNMRNNLHMNDFMHNFHIVLMSSCVYVFHIFVQSIKHSLKWWSEENIKTNSDMKSAWWTSKSNEKERHVIQIIINLQQNNYIFSCIMTYSMDSRQKPMQQQRQKKYKMHE